MDNKIYGEFTAYSKDHIKQIQNLPVVTSSGFNSVLTNMGSVESRGIEASLTVVPVRSNDWEWSLTGNVTTFESTIKELDSRFAEKFYDYEGTALLSLFKGSKVEIYMQQNQSAEFRQGNTKVRCLQVSMALSKKPLQQLTILKKMVIWVI